MGVACAPGGAGGGDRIAQGQSTREVTLRWSTWSNDTNPFNQLAAPRGVALFNERFPKIKVQIEPQIDIPGGLTWPLKNETEWIAGTGPDISGNCCEWGPVWARKGLMWNMEPAMKRDVPARIREDFVEWLIKLFHSPEHGQFSLPMYTGTIALYYNTEAFQRSGVPFPDDTWDWDKYREAATKLTKAGQNVWGRRLVTSYDRTMQRLHSNGGDWVDPKDDTRPTFDQTKAVEAFRYEWDAGHKEKIAFRESAPDAFPTGAGKTYFQSFSEGLYAMFEEGSWILARMTQTSNIPENVQLGRGPHPQGPGGARLPGHQRRLGDLEGQQGGGRVLGAGQVPDDRRVERDRLPGRGPAVRAQVLPGPLGEADQGGQPEAGDEEPGPLQERHRQGGGAPHRALPQARRGLS